MAKAVFFNIPAHGHVNPAMPVVAELVARGEDVVCLNHEMFRAQAEAAGTRFIAYPPLPQADSLMQSASEGNFARNALMLTLVGEAVLPAVIETLRREQPDYVIIDSLASWGKWGARLVKLPVVGFFSTFVLDQKSMPPIPPLALVRLAYNVMKVTPAYMGAASRLRKTHGVKTEGLISALMTEGDFNVVFTSSAFQPNAAAFDNRFRFVGPSLGSRAGGDFPFEQLSRQPVIYISLGTINNQNTDFYRQCFEAFADHTGRVVLSVGKATAIESLGAIPDNFIVRNFVPQLQVLEHADLFITHGGLNSVHEGLMANVPLVVVPQQPEQGIVANQVVKHGAGVALTPPSSSVTAEALRAAAREVLNNSAYRENSGRLGESLRAAGGATRAAEEILTFTRRSLLMPA